MTYIIRNPKLLNLNKKYFITVGTFDGVHLGHQKLFKKALILKKRKKYKIGVVTFDPIPKMFFFKKIRNYRISNFNQKLEILKRFKVDFVINKKFDLKFSKITCNRFIEKFLYKKLSAKLIFVSNNFRFGHKREGNVKLLKSLEKKYNYNRCSISKWFRST